jgi:hypothetical protein
MSTKNSFSYLAHARQTKPEAPPPEETPSPIPDPIPAPLDPAPPRIVKTPITEKKKSKREKFTTAISPDIRDAVQIELLKQRQGGGKRQEPADLIEELLLKWLRMRGIVVE